MKQTNLKYSCLIAVLYFGMNVNGQVTPQDTLPKEQKIEEVVMIGYGSRKAADNTTSTSSLKAEEITKTKVLNATQAIQGKAAGVQVTASDLPGSTPTIRIRGLGTVLGGREPLYVVDGLFADNINNVNSNDILTYDILKDASALAIYGNRGANGVVIITTKSGRGKGLTIEYDGFTGFRMPLKKVKMAGSNLFSAYNNIAIGTTKFSQDQPVNTDWFDVITRTGTYNQHNLSLSGSSRIVKYFLSVSNYDEKSILQGTDYNRATIRTNNEFKITKGITLAQNFSVAFTNTTPKPLGAFTSAYRQSPIVPVYFADGSYGVSIVGADGFASPTGNSQFNNVGNPLAQLMLNNEKQRFVQMQGGLKLDVNFLKDFKFTSQFSAEYYTFKGYNFDNGVRLPGQSPVNFSNRLASEKKDYYNWSATNYLTYNKVFADIHNIEATVGTEITLRKGENIYKYTRDNVNISDYYSLDGMDTNGDNKADRAYLDSNENRTLSFFARVQYKLMNRYLLTGTIRRDGSSQYQDGKKWGNFPSFGAGWIVSEEDFMKDGFFDQLKLRAGWGRLGNQKVPLNFLPFASGVTYNYSFGGNPVNNGNTINQVIDPELTWEITEETSGGVDFQLLSKRLSGSFDLYNKTTKNIILKSVPVSTSGIENPGYSHMGQVSNKGYEIVLGWADKINDNLSYSIGANYSNNKNNLDNITKGSKVEPIFGGGLGNGQNVKYFGPEAVGQPLGSFYLWEANGLDANGNMTYVDTNGNGVTGSADSNDRKFFGSYIPKSILGVNLGVNYKNVDLSVNGYGTFGAKVYNGKKAQRFAGENIEYDLATDFWTPSSTGSSNPAPFNAVPIASTYYLESGDFFRINNIMLGYTMRKPVEYISSLRFYVSAINPFITQKFSGFTPELNGNGDPYELSGVELDAYPTLRSFVFGMNIKF
ncbi:SusC/RagA family TonB-linked outer membrane protein [Chryseobacterium chendengshani]|uniref:SusC/RagA family TonB-linked outer membrane protein n=1 Tax=Chryseobacterium sp. LJ668 TaxID=2864040 RepID=UPI001C68771D|nr:SusC/RagA family TonB-linked outer membrane protein [Chryseobacterium sp. LJ668]MBW8523564.1 SusC/RagA family TonB-linked outer membrane protein [Chryseobacterium sp. LJ668]QYK15847.1 SusC/RagA family TonB-linked outer membrane protein [Chryseobacterium sp. LJ668]